jgi:hypothetical protein
MLSMARPVKPAHERYAAAAQRIQRRIGRALESGDYAYVSRLSARLQKLARKAAGTVGKPTTKK